MWTYRKAEVSHSSSRLFAHLSFQLCDKATLKRGEGTFLAGEVIYWEAAGYKLARLVFDCSTGLPRG